mmetsp:Transcript_31040/g.69685  ORF Transcript_31040/g.69685 Transcript_31040/m.69685 type:complete len:121 (+) Transcript_31040:652-1014(+)
MKAAKEPREVIDFLLSRGADISIKDNNGRSALDFFQFYRPSSAEITEDEEVVARLLGGEIGKPKPAKGLSVLENLEMDAPKQSAQSTKVAIPEGSKVTTFVTSNQANSKAPVEPIKISTA